MDTVSLLREQLKQAHELLEGTMQDVTGEQAQWAPPGEANPLGATYAHLVMGEDVMLNGRVKGAAPLLATTWAGKIGLSEPYPQSGSWDEWARRVQIDLPALQEYAKAVYAATDECMASLNTDELARELDLSVLGKQTVAWFLGNIMVSHANNHCGEISCLKGLQGAKGYPF